MARIFITGSADGLGQLAARQLVQQHQVVLHARSPARAEEAQAAVPQAEAAIVGEVLKLHGQGFSRRKIAEATGVSVGTVQNYLK